MQTRTWSTLQYVHVEWTTKTDTSPTTPLIISSYLCKAQRRYSCFYCSYCTPGVSPVKPHATGYGNETNGGEPPHSTHRATGLASIRLPRMPAEHAGESKRQRNAAWTNGCVGQWLGVSLLLLGEVHKTTRQEKVGTQRIVIVILIFTLPRMPAKRCRGDGYGAARWPLSLPTKQPWNGGYGARCSSKEKEPQFSSAPFIMTGLPSNLSAATVSPP